MNVFLFAIIILVLFALTKVIATAAFLFGLRFPKHNLEGRITLVLPLSGCCLTLEKLIRAIAIQTVQPRRLIIAVESTDDPAYGRAQEIAVQAGFPIEVIVAGLTTRCAQKCWNQIAALQYLDGLDDAIILLDADIEPQPNWLALLTTPILAGKADVVTGYRWCRVVRNTFTQFVMATIDRGIAILPSLKQAHLTWGGSIALSHKALNALDLPVLLAATLSDDCAIGAQAGDLGLRVLSRRLLRVSSPCYDNLVSAWKFGRRQYQIIHLYRPGLWRLAMATLTIRLCSWILLFVGIGCFPRFMIALFPLLLLSVTVTVLQQKIAHRLGLSDKLSVMGGQLTISLLEPLTTLIHWSMIAAASYTKTIRWGHICYKTKKNNDILVIARVPWKNFDNQETKEDT